MFILQPESGAILEANDAALSFYGYPRKHLQSLKITDLDASLAVQVPSIEEQQKGTMGVFQRTRHRLASGKNREVEIQKAPLDWKGLKALYAVVRDISEIIFVQEKFDAKSAFLEQLFQNSPIPIQQCSMDGRIISANTATEHLFGYSKEEMEGKLVDDLFATPETRTEAEANTRAVVEGNTIFFEGAAPQERRMYLRQRHCVPYSDERQTNGDVQSLHGSDGSEKGGGEPEKKQGAVPLPRGISRQCSAPLTAGGSFLRKPGILFVLQAVSRKTVGFQYPELYSER